MSRPFIDIVSNVGTNIQDTSSAMQVVTKRYINDAYREFVRRANITLVDDDYSFTTSDGVEDYVLPDNFRKELFAYDSTNKNELERWDLQRYLQENLPLVGNSGVADKYIIIDKPVQNQPSSASVVTFVSTSASDVSQVGLVKGISSGVEMVEQVSINGITEASTTNQFTEIISISKSATTVGKITVTANSGATTLAVLAPAVLGYRVSTIRLHPVPNGVVTIKCPYYMKPMTLVNDYETLLFECDDVVEKLATSYAWRYKRQGQKAQEWLGLYEKAINEYLWDKTNQPNMIYAVRPTSYSRETV
jgi:hypothetical protein